MRLTKYWYIIFTIALSVNLVSSSELPNKSIKSIYKKGIVKLEKVITISPDSFPENVLAKSMISLVKSKDKLYVVDIKVCDIKILDLDGLFIKSFGVKGKGPGDLLSPYLICSSNDRLVVWEIGNRRFSFFYSDGKYIKTENPKISGHLLDMKSLSDGRIILDLERVEGIEEKKEIYEWRVLELYSDDFHHQKTLYRQKQHQYKYFTKKPYRIRLPYKPELSWDISSDAKLIIGFSDKYEIIIMDINSGVKKVITREWSHVKVTEADKKEYLASLLNAENGKLKRGASKFQQQNISFPDFKPAFKKLILDHEGNILVFNNSPDDEGKPYYTANSFDVFDENGNFLNHVKLEGNKSINITKIFPSTNNELWCFDTDDEYDIDVVLIKYRIM